MDKAGRETQGAMYAIMKMTPEEIETVCEEVSGYVVPVNYNSPVQTVIAGEKEAADKAAEVFAQKGARAVPLKVSAAFHSKLMEGASKEFYEAIKDIKFNEPSVPFYSNVTGQELTDFSDMPSLLAKTYDLTCTLYFGIKCYEQCRYDKFIELGPNKVLTGLVKKTLKGSTAVNIENLKTLESALTL